MGSVYREINVGRITGLSSYELAVKNGTFVGTEAEYVAKEQKVFDDMVEKKDEFDQSVADIRTVVPFLGQRMNYLGYISDVTIIDTIYANYNTSPSIVKDPSNGFSYTFNCPGGMIIGVEQSAKYGVQARLTWTDGLDIRYKNNDTTWGCWESGVFHNLSE